MVVLEQECRMVDKKHKIFLSHAGAQKDFVEKLYQDLLRVHHFGIFFNKEDGPSLPKGEPFPRGSSMQQSTVNWPWW